MQAVRHRIKVHAAKDAVTYRLFKKTVNDLAHLLVAAVGNVENLNAVAALLHLICVFLLFLVQRIKCVVKTLDKRAVSRVESNDHITLNAVHGVFLHTVRKTKFHIYLSLNLFSGSFVSEC